MFNPRSTVALCQSTSDIAEAFWSWFPSESGVKVPREDSTKTLSHARFDKHKTTDPFAKQSAAKTAFARAYIAGEIPARINHGGVRHTLQWDVNPRGASGPSPLLLPMLMPLPAGMSHPSPASRLTLNPSRGRPLVRPTADHLLRGAHGKATPSRF